MAARVTSTRHTLRMLCLASAAWAFGFGLGAPLTSLWLRDAGYNGRVIGLNTSLYYLGVALAATLIPRLMRRAGRFCIVAGILTDAVVIAVFPWCHSPIAWFGLRLLGGMATACSLIPMETLVNHNAPADRRARDFGWYALSVALGVALGSLVGLPLYPVAPHLAFALGGVVMLAAAVAAGIAWPAQGVPGEDPAGDASPSLRANSLSYGTAWVQGFLEGGLITFLSIYLLGLGYREVEVSWLVGGLFAGVILCQVPVAWLADRLGRTQVLMGCHFLLLAALAAVYWHPGTVSLSMALFVLGTCCGSLYPLGLARLGDSVPAEGMARANACYLASNCVGSLCGPFLFGVVIDLFGQPAQFLAGILAVGFVLVVGASWGRRRPVPAPGSEQPAEVRRMAG